MPMNSTFLLTEGPLHLAVNEYLSKSNDTLCTMESRIMELDKMESITLSPPTQKESSRLPNPNQRASFCVGRLDDTNTDPHKFLWQGDYATCFEHNTHAHIQ